MSNDATTAQLHIDDLKFMRMAIEEARKCKGEAGRANPKVGAVVVKGDQVLCVAFRGEEGEGEHAEFTALEKKLQDKSLAGATVYTTLEPCTTRNHPKVPCAERLLQRRVGRVVIGMLDPNPKICGKGLWRLREQQIKTDLFPHDLMAEVEEINRDFIQAQRPSQFITQPPMNVGDEPAISETPDGNIQDSIAFPVLFLRGEHDKAIQAYQEQLTKVDDEKKQARIKIHYVFCRAKHLGDKEARTELKAKTVDPEVGAVAAFWLSELYDHEGLPGQSAEILSDAVTHASTSENKVSLLLLSARQYEATGQTEAARKAVLQVFSLNPSHSMRASAFARMSSLVSDGDHAELIRAALKARAASLEPDASRRFDAGYQLSKVDLEAAAAWQYECSGASDATYAGAMNNAFCSLHNLGLKGRSIEMLRRATDGGYALAYRNLAEQFSNAGFFEEADAIIKKGLTTLESPHELGGAMTNLHERREGENKRWEAVKKVAHSQLRVLDLVAEAVIAPQVLPIEGSWRSGGHVMELRKDKSELECIWSDGDSKLRFAGIRSGNAVIGKLGVWSIAWKSYEDKGSGYLALKSDQSLAMLLFDGDDNSRELYWERVLALPTPAPKSGQARDALPSTEANLPAIPPVE